MYVQKVRLRANKVMLILYSHAGTPVCVCVYTDSPRSVLLQSVDRATGTQNVRI